MFNRQRELKTNKDRVFSYTAFDPQSMVNFGCIGARFMISFRFEKRLFDLPPWKMFFDQI